jgi:succinyl-CoA synthetase beta subunit
MELDEFQAKQLLIRQGVACPDGRVAITADEAESAAAAVGPSGAMVKAQIRAAGRGRVGGVRRANAPAVARSAAQALLGRTLTTAPGGRGEVVRRLLIEREIAVARELYLSLFVDGGAGSIVLMAGTGGEDVEEHADALQSIALGIQAPATADLTALCQRLSLHGTTAAAFRALVGDLHRLFVTIDASLIEINPLAVTPDGSLVALDAKIVVDDHALFRHADLAGLRDLDEFDATELEAQRHQINFMSMDGDIGVVVNGAGLGLATLDMICDAGGRPANFMDIRTTAKSLDIAAGIGLVLDNPRAKVLLVNVFGGGMQPCDTIVEGLGIAVRRKGRTLPVVLRLTGNNEDLARLRLANFNLQTTECGDMWQAVTRAVAVVQGSSAASSASSSSQRRAS